MAVTIQDSEDYSIQLDSFLTSGDDIGSNFTRSHSIDDNGIILASSISSSRTPRPNIEERDMNCSDVAEPASKNHGSFADGFRNRWRLFRVYFSL
ncbi:hypothetical protein WA171_004145 [Blastocystis sp. BT1]